MFRSILIGTVILLTVLAASVGIYFMLTINSGVDDAYALWGAAEMVIDYMETHDGDWPNNWEDLQPQFNASNGNVPGWTYTRYQRRIGIDFNANVDQLRRESVKSPSATFRVIWAKHDFGVSIMEPNQLLCDYFRRKAGLPEQLP